MDGRRRFITRSLALILFEYVAPPQVLSKQNSSHDLAAAIVDPAGDGTTDDTEALNYLFSKANAGETVRLNPKKIFAIKGPLIIPQGINVETQGSVFKKIPTNNDEYAIEINSDVRIDDITLLVKNNTNQRGIHLQGSSISINRVSVNSEITGSKSKSKYVALTVGTENATCSNIVVAEVLIKNWDYPVAFVLLKDSSIKKIDILNYRRGVYVRDCVNCQFDNATLQGLSRNSKGSPGDNGLLVESVIGHKSARDLRFSNWRISDSGEHGIRLGGAYQIDAVTFTGIKVYRPGVGYQSGGGCGIKIRGFNPKKTLHTNINLTSIDIYDCRDKGANFSSLFIALCDQVNVDRLRIKRDKNSFSGQYGISVLSSSNINIGNSQVLDCVKHALRIYTGNEKDFAPRLENILISDAVLTNTETSNSSVVSFEADTVLFTNIRMERCKIEGGTAAVVALRPKDRGGYVASQLQFAYLSKKIRNKPKMPVIGTADFLIDMSVDLENLDRVEAKSGSKINTHTSKYKKITGKWIKHGSQVNK